MNFHAPFFTRRISKFERAHTDGAFIALYEKHLFFPKPKKKTYKSPLLRLITRMCVFGLGFSHFHDAEQSS